MKSCALAVLASIILCIDAREAHAQEAAVYPMALFRFEERGLGAKDLGAKATDLLFAKLAARSDLYLVDRAELEKTLSELALSISGAVKPGEANKVGELTGARLLVTGSIVESDKRLYLVAKVIGTETSRVMAASVDGKASDELGPLVEKLAGALAETITKNADKLVPKPSPTKDRVASIKAQLKDAKRPVLMITLPERHIGAPSVDPAAQTELSLLCKETGFELVDADEAGKGKADVIITGEAFSETAGRVGNLFSVKARVEVKAVDRKTGKVLAADRQNAVVVDLSEQIAGKAALQLAADQLAERLIPKLVAEVK